MFQFVFFVFLFSTSARLVDGLVCANNCEYSSNIDNITFPSCTVIDRPSTEQSCQLGLTIDYVSGSITARLNARTPPQSFTFDAATVFSLSDQASNLTIEFDCSTTDTCDLVFINDLLSSDWIKVQNQVKDMRKILADILFNATDLRPSETCPANQPCSGQGFCLVFYQAWSDATRPILQSTCANSTEKPRIDWIQAYDQTKTGQIMAYTCNEPACAASPIIDSVIRIIERDYILPFNVTIPPLPTTTPLTSPPPPPTTPSMTTMPTTTTPSMTTMSTATSMPTVATTKKNAAGKSIHLDRSEKMIFAFVFLLLLCLF